MNASPPMLTQQLAELIAQGLTFAQATHVFAAGQGGDAGAVIERARELHACDGEIEIDQDAMLSASEDGGDYVMAWVWVPHPHLEDDLDTTNQEADPAVS